ncbi:thiol:disulfide interchange protein DsbA [Thalassotalea insulae]|uniref:Thiol:disulfide interchange protein n=1 Tax=Thalassotalea insulae TaxID=2056778 RepID=A0ABQ6GQQ2_9GAMM|nr:thiol:disulfide interchange protein DsbA/DsbL [Thalassotalea insulae]GLX78221.1 thiol:disulfide interchange protein DsbA [Thalassotalea insulae]
MKKIMTLLGIMLVSMLANGTEYQEGKHYVKVKEIAVETPEVREYFSFYCPHCFRFEPLVAEIKKALPEKAVFVKNHVDFLPGASKKMQSLLTKALITAQKMDIAESQIEAIFKYIHVHRAVFTSEKDVRNVFVLNGADGEQFERLMASEEVAKAAAQMKSNQDALSQSGDLKSVPTIIVNGKYMIHAHDLDKENFVEDYNKLVKYLLALG